jgi:hypothetical protein
MGTICGAGSTTTGAVSKYGGAGMMTVGGAAVTGYGATTGGAAGIADAIGCAAQG